MKPLGVWTRLTIYLPDNAIVRGCAPWQEQQFHGAGCLPPTFVPTQEMREDRGSECFCSQTQNQTT